MSLRLVKPAAKLPGWRRHALLYAATAAMWLILLAEVLVPVAAPTVQWPTGTYVLTASAAVALIVICVAYYLRDGMRAEADRFKGAVEQATPWVLGAFQDGIHLGHNMRVAGRNGAYLPQPPPTRPARDPDATVEFPQTGDDTRGHGVVVPIRQQPRPRPHRD